MAAADGWMADDAVRDFAWTVHAMAVCCSLFLLFLLAEDCEAGRKVRPAQELDSQKKNQIDGAIV